MRTTPSSPSTTASGARPARRSVTLVTGGRVHLTPGRLNDAARSAFTSGHCANLALALHRRTGWDLKVLVNASDGWTNLSDHQPWVAAANRGAHLPQRVLDDLWAHVYVQRPDGMLVDVYGPQTPDTAIATWTHLPAGPHILDYAADRDRLVSADADQVAALTSTAPQSPGLGEMFVDAVLALDAVPEQPFPWQRAMAEFIASGLEPDEDGRVYFEDTLVELHEDYRLLEEALRRHLIPADWLGVARKIADPDRNFAEPAA